MKWAVFLMFLATPVVASETTLWKNVAGWQVRIDPTVGNGCFLMTEYEGGTILRVGLAPSTSQIYLLIADPAWKSLEVDKEYQLHLQFGARSPWDAPARAVDMGGGVPFLMVTADESNLFEEFMLQTHLVVKFDGEVVANLSLRGTATAGSELLTCQERLNDAAPKERDPFAKPVKRDPFRS